MVVFSSYSAGFASLRASAFPAPANLTAIFKFLRPISVFSAQNPQLLPLGQGTLQGFEGISYLSSSQTGTYSQFSLEVFDQFSESAAISDVACRAALFLAVDGSRQGSGLHCCLSLALRSSAASWLAIVPRGTFAFCVGVHLRFGWVPNADG